jgi:hypothetical protein
MGLFFKKRVKELPPLDLPPSPTRIEQKGFGNLPPLPPIPKAGAMKTEGYMHLQELPPLPKIEPEKMETEKFEFPELPPLHEIEHEELKETPMPEHEAQEWHDFFKEPEKITPETLPHIEAPKPLKALELPEAEERQFHDLRPLFVKSDDYKEIMRGIQDIKAKVNESDSILLNLNEVKNQKDKEFQKMHNQIADIQRKLVYIDKTVFGG